MPGSTGATMSPALTPASVSRLSARSRTAGKGERVSILRIRAAQIGFQGAQELVLDEDPALERLPAVRSPEILKLAVGELPRVVRALDDIAMGVAGVAISAPELAAHVRVQGPKIHAGPLRRVEDRFRRERHELRAAEALIEDGQSDSRTCRTVRAAADAQTRCPRHALTVRPSASPTVRLRLTHIAPSRTVRTRGSPIAARARHRSPGRARIGTAARWEQWVWDWGTREAPACAPSGVRFSFCNTNPEFIPK